MPKQRMDQGGNQSGNRPPPPPPPPMAIPNLLWCVFVTYINPYPSLHFFDSEHSQKAPVSEGLLPRTQELNPKMFPLKRVTRLPPRPCKHPKHEACPLGWQNAQSS